MIHYTQVTCLGTIKNSPTTIVCDLDRGVQLTQVINLPRSPLWNIVDGFSKIMVVDYKCDQAKQ